VVTLYGHFYLSADLFIPACSTGNPRRQSPHSSYFGVRARHNLAPYGWKVGSIVPELVAAIYAAASTHERAAFGRRDSYVVSRVRGSPVKAGKSGYSALQKSTAAMDPFANPLGCYTSILGANTAGQPAKFDWRINHAIWYNPTPIVSGFSSARWLRRVELWPGGRNNSDYS